ncbi:MAG: hypothetical protein ACN6O3_03910 [Comamonas sp.]
MPLFTKPGAGLHPFDARSVLLFASMAVSSAMAQTPVAAPSPAARLAAPASQSRLPLPMGQAHQWPGPRRPRSEP